MTTMKSMKCPICHANFSTPPRYDGDPIHLNCRGVVKPLKEWCNERGLNYRTLYSRVSHLPWESGEDWCGTCAVEAPVGDRQKLKEYAEHRREEVVALKEKVTARAKEYTDEIQSKVTQPFREYNKLIEQKLKELEELVAVVRAKEASGGFPYDGLAHHIPTNEYNAQLVSEFSDEYRSLGLEMSHKPLDVTFNLVEPAPYYRYQISPRVNA